MVTPVTMDTFRGLSSQQRVSSDNAFIFEPGDFLICFLTFTLGYHGILPLNF